MIKRASLYLAFCILISVGCKKESQTPPVKTVILGAWYYTAYEVKYYDQNSNLMYDATAGSYNLNSYGTLYFSADNSYSYGDGFGSFQIKSSGGVDSLIVAGGINGGSRFLITSITNDKMQLQSLQPGGVFFTNKSQWGTSAYSFTYSTLARSR